VSDTAHRFSHQAMASPWDIHVVYGDAVYAGQAAQAAFAEVDLIEREISRFIATSDVAQINNLAPDTWARVGEHALECLKASARVGADTGGAFDVTIGPLMACWRNPDRSPRTPSDAELAAVRARVGMRLLEVDEKERRVRVRAAGVEVDLGGIGKGYAVERAAAVLKEWGVESGLVNGGDSSAFGFGRQPGQDGWPVGVGGVGEEPVAPYRLLLRNRSLSGSGVQARGRHIMDPRTGRPVPGKRAVWALHPSATIADALSTAFFVMKPEEVAGYCRRHADTSAMIVLDGCDERQRYGTWDLIQAR
jgi:FAD:protein FMN transferase